MTASESPAPDDAGHRIARLETAVERVQDAVQGFRFRHLTEVEATKNGMTLLYAQQERLQEEVSGFRAETTAHWASLTTDVAGLKTDVTALTTDVAGLKTDVTALTTDVAGLKTAVTALTTDVAGLKTDVTALTTDVSEILRLLRER